MKKYLTVFNVVVLFIAIGVTVLVTNLVCNRKPTGITVDTQRYHEMEHQLFDQQERIQAILDSNAMLLQLDSSRSAYYLQLAAENAALHQQRLQDQLKRSNEKITRIYGYGSDSLRSAFAEAYGY